MGVGEHGPRIGFTFYRGRGRRPASGRKYFQGRTYVMTTSAAPTVMGPNIDGREATIEAAKACLRAAGYDEERIGRAIQVLDGSEEDCPSMEQMLTAEEVCEWLDISTSTLWRYGIPHVKLGGLRRYYPADVKQYLNCRYVHKPRNEKAVRCPPRTQRSSTSCPEAPGGRGLSRDRDPLGSQTSGRGDLACPVRVAA